MLFSYSAFVGWPKNHYQRVKAKEKGNGCYHTDNVLKAAKASKQRLISQFQTPPIEGFDRAIFAQHSLISYVENLDIACNLCR